MRVSGDLVEGLALVMIAVTITSGGRALLTQLHLFEPAAVALLGIAVVAMSLSIRRVLVRGGDARLAVTVRAAYVTALLLTIVATIFPTRASTGAAIAIVDIAIAFDLFSRVTHRNAD